MSVAATVSAPQAAAERWDIAVVGAGPAGSWLAGLTAAAGLRCLLVDRCGFPRPKVCGGCLSARTVAQLEQAGVAADLLAQGARRLERLWLRGWSRPVELPLPPGIAVSRGLLDTVLLRSAIERGAHFLARHRVVLDGAPDGAGIRRLRLSGGGGPTLCASIVVDATGLGGSLIGREAALRRRAGRRVGCSAMLRGSRRVEPGVVHIAVGRHGYVGAVAVEDDRLNLAAALDGVTVRRLGLAETVRRTLWEAGAVIPDALTDAEWAGTPPLTQRPTTRATERLFAVGDAAGYVEPFTGEGIGWAMRSAALLAPIAVEAARRWSGDLVAAWNATHDRELVRRQRGCRALTWLSRHPWAARCALSALRRAPQLGTPLIRHLHGPDLVAATTPRR